jgi:hypothetical protein
MNNTALQVVALGHSSNAAASADLHVDLRVGRPGPVAASVGAALIRRRSYLAPYLRIITAFQATLSIVRNLITLTPSNLTIPCH